MADPRNAPDYNEQGALYLPFIIDNSTITYSATATTTAGIGGAGSASTGLAVTLSADKTVKLTEAGDAVLGKLVSVESDLRCTVQVAGTMKLPAGDSVSTTYGKKIVGALGAASAKGYIKEIGDAGASPSQAEVNAIAKARGMILDDTTTTAVAVLLP